MEEAWERKMKWKKRSVADHCDDHLHCRSRDTRPVRRKTIDWAACRVSRDVHSLHERRLRCRPSMYGQAISSTFASLIENQRSSHSKKTTKLRFRV